MLPRAIMSVARLPVALGVTGAGTLAYIEYKIEQIPSPLDFVKDSADFASEIIKVCHIV